VTDRHTDRADRQRQRTDSIGRTVLQTVAQKRSHVADHAPPLSWCFVTARTCCDQLICQIWSLYLHWF